VKELRDAGAVKIAREKAHGRLILTVLGGLAEFERDLIRTRTTEGRARAKAQGVKLGRKPTLTPHQKAEAIQAPQGGQGIHRRDCAQLQRQPLDGFEACVMNAVRPDGAGKKERFP
jgi:DNA invertase Pin-like site-specific DNA recombinase